MWRVGEIRNILWTASDDREVAKIDIYYRVGYGTPWRVIARDLPNTGSYSWRIPEDIHFSSEHGYVWCWIRVLAFDRNNNIGEDTNDNEFVIRPAETGVTPVQVRVISPNGGEFWRVGNSVHIRWIITGLWARVDISLSRDGGRTWELIGRRTSGNYCFWRVSGLPSTNCLIKASEERL